MKNILLICLLCISAISAQNTIGGNKVIVPEAEVARQSQFLEAEKERLLAHYDKAIERYEKFVYDNPQADAAWYGLARSYVAKEDYVKADEAIEKSVKIAPQNQWYLIQQADIFVKTGRAISKAALTEENFSMMHSYAVHFVEHEYPELYLKHCHALSALNRHIAGEARENLGDILNRKTAGDAGVTFRRNSSGPDAKVA